MSLRSYLPIIGLFLLVISVVLLCSDPEPVFSRGVSFVSTELGWKTGEETLVWAKSGFKSNERMMDFPRRVGTWEGYDSNPEAAADLRETLGASVFLMRTYRKPGLSPPVFFLIVQARESSAFHPPPVCYKGLGYRVEEDKDTVRISPGQAGDVHVGGVVPMKKLWLTRITDGEVTERQIAIYCYLKGNQFTGDTMNLIRFSTLAPVDGPPDGVLRHMKEFAGLALPHLFEVRDYQTEILFTRLAGEGTGGWLMIAVAFAFPGALITAPYWKGKASKRDE
ncbi:MAG: hypothetical protein DDT27_01122 [Dehalococcoidia bacterium]|nr:hypothetical protein [Chloroflexota bacterium]